MPPVRFVPVLLGCVLVPGLDGCRQPPAASADSPRAALSTARAADGGFAFRSGFWANLHHFLHAMAGYELSVPRTPRLAAEDLELVASLDGPDAEAWAAAVTYYRVGLATRDLLFDPEMRRLGLAIAATGDDAMPDTAAIGGPHSAVLAAAAGPYRKTCWPRHDAANRRWIAGIRTMIDEHGAGMRATLLAAYRTQWPPAPIPVVVSAYAGWAGAYTSRDPAHVTIASMDRRHRGLVALETIYHEAAHTFELDFVDEIARQAERQRRPVPDQLWHGIIFYTSGDAVRRVADPAYEPYADRFGLWRRGPFPAYRRVLEAHWQRYLDGEASFTSAVAGMVRDI
ncbi:MAG: hypothetical protein ACYTJ0_07890 [Planctomycetota bacterium]|jgi:hypothetical protein